MTPDHSAHECPIIPEYIFPLNCNYYSKSDYAVLLGSSLLTLTYVVINIAIMKHGKIHSLYLCKFFHNLIARLQGSIMIQLINYVVMLA